MNGYEVAIQGVNTFLAAILDALGGLV